MKASPVIVDDRVIIGSYDGNLYCLSLKDGKLLWGFKTNGPVHATASVASGIAYISGCDGVLRGIRISDGKEVTSITTGSYTGASPALSPTGSVFFGTFDNNVLAFNLKTKKAMWSYENPQRQFPFYSSAALVDGRVILGGRDKIVHCLNAATGKQNWEFATRSRVESSPGGGRGPGLCRLERREILRARCIHRRETLGVRSRRAALRIAGDRARPNRHRLTGRETLLLRRLIFRLTLIDVH